MSMLERWDAVMMRNYGTPPVGIVRGSGTRVWDESGTEYLDMLAGIAVNSLGHAHPAIIDAVTEQLSTLGHTSNLVATEPGIALAEQLIAIAGRPGRVFLCNSGAEANEAAFKLTRLTGRSRTVVAHGAFHGRTMGALAWTAQPAKQDPFRPLPGEVDVVPFNDIGAMERVIGADTAAVVLEPIQGEGGVVPAEPGYLSAVEQLCRAHGALFILDEVQTGIGRTGTWFAQHSAGVQPDAMLLAKGLAGGLPIGAVLAFGDLANAFQPGSHGSTFGGNPVSAAAALAVLRTIESENLLMNVRERSAQISQGLAGLSDVDHVRGQGLLLGVVLTEPTAKEFEGRLRAKGVLANAVNDQVIRLAPPFILTSDDVQLFLTRWQHAAAAVNV